MGKDELIIARVVIDEGGRHDSTTAVGAVPTLDIVGERGRILTDDRSVDADLEGSGLNQLLTEVPSANKGKAATLGQVIQRPRRHAKIGAHSFSGNCLTDADRP